MTENGLHTNRINNENKELDKNEEEEKPIGGGDDVANRTPVPFDPSKEVLLKENPRRFVLFPIEFHDIWQMYKKVSESAIY